jgi:hypothetical protein
VDPETGHKRATAMQNASGPVVASILNARARGRRGRRRHPRPGASSSPSCSRRSPSIGQRQLLAVMRAEVALAGRCQRLAIVLAAAALEPADASSSPSCSRPAPSTRPVPAPRRRARCRRPRSPAPRHRARGPRAPSRRPRPVPPRRRQEPGVARDRAAGRGGRDGSRANAAEEPGRRPLAAPCEAHLCHGVLREVGCGPPSAEVPPTDRLAPETHMAGLAAIAHNFKGLGARRDGARGSRIAHAAGPPAEVAVQPRLDASHQNDRTAAEHARS